MKKYHRMTWLIMLTIVITPILVYLYLPQFAKISILEKICTTTNAVLVLTGCRLAFFPNKCLIETLNLIILKMII